MNTTCREKAAVFAILVVIAATSVNNLCAEEMAPNSTINIQDPQSVSMNGGTMMNGVTMKDGKMMVVKDGKTGVMDVDMTMSDGTKVMKNGNIVMKNGKTMMMTDGQRLNADGQLLGLDGIIVTTDDQVSDTINNSITSGVIMKDGQLMVIKDGTSTQMTEDMSMSDGTKVLKNGTILTRDGRTLMMKNGQSISTDGKFNDDSINQ